MNVESSITHIAFSTWLLAHGCSRIPAGGSGNRSHAAYTLLSSCGSSHTTTQTSPACTDARPEPVLPFDAPLTCHTTGRMTGRRRHNPREPPHNPCLSLCVDAELFNRNPPRPEWRTASRSRPGPSALSTERWRQNRILHGYQDRLDSISPSVQKSAMRTFTEEPSPHGVQL